MNLGAKYLRRTAVVCATVATCLSTITAHAQRTGTLVPRGEGSSMVDNANMQSGFKKTSAENRQVTRQQVDSARRTMRSYSACVLTAMDTRRERDDLAAFLRAASEARVSELGRKISRPECLRNAGADYVQLRYSADLLRGAIFRELYLGGSGASQRLHFGSEEIAFDEANASNGMKYYRAMGDCVIAARPAEARAMVASALGSAQEDAAVRSLAPTIGGCIDRGVSMQLSRATIEGVLAESLYRREIGATVAEVQK